MVTIVYMIIKMSNPDFKFSLVILLSSWTHCMVMTEAKNWTHLKAKITKIINSELPENAID